MVSGTMFEKTRSETTIGAVMSWPVAIKEWSFVGRGWDLEETGPTLGWDGLGRVSRPAEG
jgi:hypothetical protein